MTAMAAGRRRDGGTGGGAFAPVANVFAGFVLQGVLQVALAIAGLALVRATNPAAPASGPTHDNPWLGPIMVVTLLPGVVPWFAIVVVRGLGGLRGPREAQIAAVVLGVLLSAGIVAIAAFAALGLGLAGVVCPADAYECPL